MTKTTPRDATVGVRRSASAAAPIAAPVEVPASAAARRATLVLEDGSTYPGRSFGAERSIAGEVVFNTGMVGYVESLTDPSYRGQILVSTYPLVGNYGVPAPREVHGLAAHLESDGIHAAGMIVADYSTAYSHWNAAESLGDWLRREGIPGLTGIDTRGLTQRLRERGTMLGRIEFDGDPVEQRDPNLENLVAEVSTSGRVTYGLGDRRVVLFDTGVKHIIMLSLVERGVTVVRVPWNDDFADESFDGLVLSNGPGDPTTIEPTVEQVRRVLARDVPTFGVCLGNQILALAIGATTYKLKYGHRGQNQPVVECGTDRCFVTSQNHGYAVDTSSLPSDWRPWFENLNDGTNEGIRHAWAPFRSVQFHPEANPGPVDTAFLFDEFVQIIHR